MSCNVYLRQVIFTTLCVQAAFPSWVLQNGQQHVYNPFTSQLHPSNPYAPSGAASPPWQFSSPKSGVPTWIITTTEIETRNETVASVDGGNDDSDDPVGPNLKEDGTVTPDVEDADPDVEFPVRHGKDPAIKARPAFADPEKYEETTTTLPSVENAINKTKMVTVNRTTVVKIEFVNTAFLPLVLRIDSSHKSSPENNTKTEEQQQQNESLSTSAQTYSQGNEGLSGEGKANVGQQDQANQDSGSVAKDQQTTSTFQIVQDPGQPQAGGPQQVAGTPVSYEHVVQHLQPLPPPVQPLYSPQYVNYWKRR